MTLVFGKSRPHIQNPSPPHPRLGFPARTKRTSIKLRLDSQQRKRAQLAYHVSPQNNYTCYVLPSLCPSQSIFSDDDLTSVASEKPHSRVTGNREHYLAKHLGVLPTGELAFFSWPQASFMSCRPCVCLGSFPASGGFEGLT